MASLVAVIGIHGDQGLGWGAFAHFGKQLDPILKAELLEAWVGDTEVHGLRWRVIPTGMVFEGFAFAFFIHPEVFWVGLEGVHVPPDDAAPCVPERQVGVGTLAGLAIPLPASFADGHQRAVRVPTFRPAPCEEGLAGDEVRFFEKLARFQFHASIFRGDCPGFRRSEETATQSLQEVEHGMLQGEDRVPHQPNPFPFDSKHVSFLVQLGQFPGVIFGDQFGARQGHQDPFPFELLFRN